MTHPHSPRERLRHRDWNQPSWQNGEQSGGHVPAPLASPRVAPPVGGNQPRRAASGQSQGKRAKNTSRAILIAAGILGAIGLGATLWSMAPEWMERNRLAVAYISTIARWAPVVLTSLLIYAYLAVSLERSWVARERKKRKAEELDSRRRKERLERKRREHASRWRDVSAALFLPDTMVCFPCRIVDISTEGVLVALHHDDYAPSDTVVLFDRDRGKTSRCVVWWRIKERMELKIDHDFVCGDEQEAQYREFLQERISEAQALKSECG